MPGKNLVSNNLLGKWIRPVPGYGSPTGNALTSTSANIRIWQGINPDAAGLFRAQIVAVWVEEGTIKVSAADAYGNVTDFYLKNVQLETI